jgi:hypothetical protein
MRGALSLTSYLLFTGFLALLLCLIPYQAVVLAFAPSGYMRVVEQAEQIALQYAQRTAASAALGNAIANPGTASLLFRVSTGLGWAGLGIGIGLALLQMYYGQQDLQKEREAETANNGGGTYTDPSTGQSYPVPSASSSKAKNADCPGGYMYYFPPPAPPGLGGTGITDWYCLPSPATPAGPPTPQQAQQWANGLPATDPNSMENHTVPMGGGSGGGGGGTATGTGIGVGVGPQPAVADHTTVVPITPDQVKTVVKPTSQVLPTDLVVNPDAGPPAGTSQTTNKNQDITTITRTITNPDGSTTKQDTDQATVSCAASGKGEATFASVLAAHQATWTNSGLLGTLKGLQNLVWVDTLPVVSLPSTMFGNQTLDFTQWAWAFAAIKAITLAGASLAAYRIVFG